MSISVARQCWPLPMSPTQKLVLICLADHADEWRSCWPSIGTIAKRTCLSDRAVQKALAWLQASGIVQRVARHMQSSHFHIRPTQPCPDNAAGDSQELNIISNSQGERRSGGVNHVHPEPP